MSELKIEEKYSARWPFVTFASMILAVMTFIALLFIESTLFAGYARLFAFAFFALGVIGLFKLRDGKVLMTFSMDQDHFLTTEYTINNQLKHSESWDLKKIATVKVNEMPNRSFYNDIVTSDRCVAIRNTNESDWTYLHKIYGRVIPLKSGSANKLKTFIESEIAKIGSVERGASNI